MRVVRRRSARTRAAEADPTYHARMIDPGAPTTRALVVLPALNEGPSVGAVVRDVKANLPRYDVLVVDDGSSDNTAQNAAAAGALVCSLPFNLGVGGAMRTAYKYADRHGYDVVVQVDADGQHDPRYVEELVSKLSDADLVIGARFAGVGEYQTAFFRRLAMRSRTDASCSLAILSASPQGLSGWPLRSMSWRIESIVNPRSRA